MMSHTLENRPTELFIRSRAQPSDEEFVNRRGKCLVLAPDGRPHGRASTFF